VAVCPAAGAVREQAERVPLETETLAGEALDDAREQVDGTDDHAVAEERAGDGSVAVEAVLAGSAGGGAVQCVRGHVVVSVEASSRNLIILYA
jgi:hypothetical protein